MPTFNFTSRDQSRQTQRFSQSQGLRGKCQTIKKYILFLLCSDMPAHCGIENTGAGNNQSISSINYIVSFEKLYFASIKTWHNDGSNFLHKTFYILRILQFIRGFQYTHNRSPANLILGYGNLWNTESIHRQYTYIRFIF